MTILYINIYWDDYGGGDGSDGGGDDVFDT